MASVLDDRAWWIAAAVSAVLLATATTAMCSVEPTFTAKDEAEQAFSEETGEPASDREDDRLFPLWADRARERGVDLPPPIGIAATMGYLGTEYGFGHVRLSLGDDELIDYDLTSSAVTYGTYTTGIKADRWVLPFMNLMFITGYTDVDVLVTLHDIPVGVGGIPPQVQIEDKILEIHFQGPYYGGGVVLAAGWRNYFITVDLVETIQVLEAQIEGQDDDTVRAFTAAPRLGYRTGRTEVWAGARYITSDRRFSGTVNDLNYDLEVYETTWNFLMGMHTLIHDHWDVVVEGGIGDREMIVFNVGYRW